MGNLHLFTQGGVEFEGDDEEAFVNIGGILPVGDTAFVTVEWNWSEEMQYLTPGIVVRASEEWEIGFGVAVGLNNDADDYRLTLSVIFER